MGGMPQSPGLKPLGRPTSGAALPLLSTLWLADLCIGTAAPGLKPAAGGCGAAAGCAAAVALLGASGVVHWAAGPAVALGTEAEGVLGCWCAAGDIAGGPGCGCAGKGGLIHCSRWALF